MYLYLFFLRLCMHRPYCSSSLLVVVTGYVVVVAGNVGGFGHGATKRVLVEERHTFYGRIPFLPTYETLCLSTH
jgi:hypothetical protein